MAEKPSVSRYIHPTDPNNDMINPFLGYPHLTGSVRGYAVGTGICTMRLICSGLFDKFPGLTITLGHPGEANKDADFMETAPISDIDKEKIYHLNVEKLLKLPGNNYGPT